MIYTATCLNCGRTVFSTRKTNSCAGCGRIMMTETNPERDARLGIKKGDPGTWNNPDPLLAHLEEKKSLARLNQRKGV